MVPQVTGDTEEALRTDVVNNWNGSVESMQYKGLLWNSKYAVEKNQTQDAELTAVWNGIVEFNVPLDTV